MSREAEASSAQRDYRDAVRNEVTSIGLAALRLHLND